MEQAFYSVLDIGLRIDAPPGVLADLDRVYGSLRAPDPAARTVVLRITPEPVDRMQVLSPWGVLSVAANEIVHALAFVIQHYVVRQSERFYVLHGACVAWGNRGAILSAASTTGKTTLCARLVQRGAGYLSDELAPIDCETGRLHAFARALGLREGGLRALGMDGSEAGSVLPIGDDIKYVVDAKVLDASRAVDVVRPVCFCLLTPPPDGSGLDAGDGDALELHVAVEGEGFASGLRGIQGVRSVDPGERGADSLLRIVSEPGAALVRGIDDLAVATGTLIRAHHRYWTAPIDYGLSPVCSALPADELLRAVLPAVINGSAAKGVAWMHGLLASLADASCHRIVPGRLDETAALVEDLARG